MTCNISLRCRTAMSHYNISLRCRTAMSHCDVALQCRTAMLHCNVALQCQTPVLCWKHSLSSQTLHWMESVTLIISSSPLLFVDNIGPQLHSVWIMGHVVCIGTLFLLNYCSLPFLVLLNTLLQARPPMLSRLLTHDSLSWPHVRASHITDGELGFILSVRKLWADNC